MFMSLAIEFAKAAILGAVILYGTSRVIENDIRHLKEDVQELKSAVNEIKRDIYRPIFIDPPFKARDSNL